MRRGMQQVLFKYLPGKPIDYSQGNVIAVVDRFWGNKVTDVNKTRIVREIYKAIRKFDHKRGFPAVADPSAFELLEPVQVEAEIFPLTFICDNCSRAYSFASVKQFHGVLKRAKCFCGGPLSQIDLVYTHECGELWAPRTAGCEDHKFENIALNKHGSSSPQNWRWECGICHKEKSLNNYCPSCRPSSIVYPKPFSQTSVFTPHSLTFVNIQDVKEERIYENDMFKKLVLAEYLGLLKKYGTTTEQCLEASDNDDAELEKMIADLKEKNMPQETIDAVVESMRKVRPSMKDTRDKALREVSRLVKPANGDMADAALKTYEFMQTLRTPGTISLDKIMKAAREVSHPNLERIEKFPSRMQMIGVKNAYVLNDLSILKVVYGFTRGKPEDEDKTLNRFAPDKIEKSKVPVYLSKSNTEAILLELDRWQILKWLQANGALHDIPESDNEAELKAWFLNNIDTYSITPYGEIDSRSQATKLVYKLLHSISHSLIITGSVECGLDKSSMAELIMPSIPAVIIYCSNAHEFQTGGMFTLFENNIYPWIDKTVEKVKSCIYDPICMDHRSACHACLHLSEISCVRFNHDVGRDVLVGNSGARPMTGFWSKEFKKTLGS